MHLLPPSLNARQRSLVWLLVLGGFSAALRADPIGSGYVLDSSVSDDFTGPTLDTTKWIALDSGGATNPGKSLRAQSYMLPANLTFTNHPAMGPSLVVNCLEPATPAPKGELFTSGGLQSTQLLGYGYYEVQAMLTNVRGWRSAFRLGSATVANAATPVNGIDIATVDSYKPERVAFTLRYEPMQGSTKAMLKEIVYGLDPVAPATTRATGVVTLTTGNTSADVPHVYAMDWSPTQVIWYVDGTEVRRSSYPGPHAACPVQIFAQGLNTGGAGVAGATSIAVGYFKYWRKNYGLDSATGSIVAPVAMSGYWRTSQIATNHRGFDSTATTSSAIYDAKQAVAAGATVKWDFPSAGAAGGYEVFAWNPSVYSTTFLTPENPDLSSFPVQYTVTSQAGAVTAMAVDRIADAPQWFSLGAYSFAPGSGHTVQLTTGAMTIYPTNVAGVMYRALNWGYDDFSGGALSGWTIGGGTWSVAGGIVQQSSTADGRLLRTAVSGADGFVRAGVLRGTATSVGVLGRYVDSTHCYLLRFDGANNLALFKNTPTGWTSLQTVALPSINFAQWVDLMLVMNGGALRGFVNGREYLNVIDSAPYGAGAFGVRAYGGTAQFDRVGAGN